jgi:hypothetical protein
MKIASATQPVSSATTHQFSMPVVREVPLPPADPQGNGGW